MATSANPFSPRPMDEVKKELLLRAKEMRNPFLHTVYEEVAPVIQDLKSVERENGRGSSAPWLLPGRTKPRAPRLTATARQQ